MGIFANILKKLGLGRDEPKLDVRPYGPKKTIPGVGPGGGGGGGGGAVATPDKPVAISEVDVVAQLEKRAADNPQKLNWRTSIVDLLKLLDIDSSLQARKELAAELKYTGDTSDSASMNIWLHKQVMQKLAANGGKVPAEFLD